MDDAQNTTVDPFGDGPITPERLATLFAVVDLAVFTFVGYLIFDQPAIGALAGLFVGTGVYLFLPLFLRAGEDGDLEDLEPDDPGHPLRTFNRLAAGFAISPGGIVILMPLFADANPFLGIPAGIAVSAVLYVVLAWVLPNPQL